MERKQMISRIRTGMLIAGLTVSMVAAACGTAHAHLLSWLFGPSVPRALVEYRSPYPRGTIVVNTSERRLYLVTGPNQALRYGIGVGRVGFTWSGTTAIS